MNVVILALLLQTFLREVTSFNCEDNRVGKCLCEKGKRVTYQVYCPSIKQSRNKVNLYVSHSDSVIVDCVPRASSEEIFPLLNSLDVGEITTLKFQGCPFPPDSYQETMEEMGISGVKRLWISGSRARGQNFDKHLLRNLSVTILELRNVNLINIDKDFFPTSVRKLNLVSKGIQLRSDSFQNIPHLTSLGLSSSGIRSLHKDVLKQLTDLEDLNLHGNELTQLPSGIFDNNKQLKTVNLAKNKLRNLPENIFSENSELKNALLSINCFESLPEYLLADKQNLELFDFRYDPRSSKCKNKIEFIDLPETLIQNSSIKELKFLHIYATSIPENFFKGCKNLKTIIIQSTKIKTIPRELFKNTPSVEKIDFVNNQISELDENTFSGLTNLTILRLKLNNISLIEPKLFKSISKLKTLHLDNNNIEYISDDVFKMIPKLEELIISNNKLTTVPGRNLKELSVLKKLKIAHNLITYLNIEDILKLERLESIDLGANKISGNLDISRIGTPYRSVEVSINLSHNKIERIIVHKDLKLKTKVNLYITDNPLICDCFATEIKELNAFAEATKLFVNQEYFMCSQSKNLLSTSFSQLNCPFPSEMINESCPKNCTCSLNRKSRRTSVNCTEQGLTQIPSNLPMLPDESDGIILHVENNLLTNLTASLERLASPNLSNLPVLSELHLSGNKLNHVDHKLLPDKLEFLGLDNNNIKYYSNLTIQYFLDQVKHSNLSLRLGNNPYDCNCNSLELHHFLKSSYSHIEDFNITTVKCLETKELFLLNEVDFCSMKPQLLTAMIPIALIFFAILFLLICQIFYKETILIWVFSKSWGKIFFSEELVDKNKPHDAFLSYSHHDSEFVEKTLLPGLESDDNPMEFQYKCLIHTRDWNVGEMITDQIVESVESSRRTIIVLSKGYIQSMWTKMEFKTAHNKALRDNTQRVVIILHGEKPTKEDLDEDLQKYLTTNTFIDSEDPWFWKKLRYALPKKSRKQKQKLNDLSDISTMKVNNHKAEHLSIHDKLSYNQNQGKIHDSKNVNKDTPQQTYNTQLSRELLLSSESLERELEATEYIV